MKVNKCVPRLLASVLCAMTLCLCAPAALAAETIDQTKDSSLTLTYKYTDGSSTVLLPKAAVKLYRVGDLNDNFVYTLTGGFAKYKTTVKVNDLSSASDWQAAADTLEGYAVADKIDAVTDTPKTTDLNGVVRFTGLKPGLYLFSSGTVKIMDTVYTPKNGLICLPYPDANGKLDYAVTAVPKISADTPTGQRVKISAVKKWADVGYETKRPVNVTVKLYKNDTIYDTQVLSSANNWKYTWAVISDGSTWKLVENDPGSGYTVSVVLNGKVFTVINTLTDKTKPGLPQTGQLWWPVALLAGTGLVLFATGWAVKRKDEDAQ